MPIPPTYGDLSTNNADLRLMRMHHWQLQVLVDLAILQAVGPGGATALPASGETDRAWVSLTFVYQQHADLLHVVQRPGHPDLQPGAYEHQSLFNVFANYRIGTQTEVVFLFIGSTAGHPIPFGNTKPVFDALFGEGTTRTLDKLDLTIHEVGGFTNFDLRATHTTLGLDIRATGKAPAGDQPPPNVPTATWNRLFLDPVPVKSRFVRGNGTALGAQVELGVENSSVSWQTTNNLEIKGQLKVPKGVIVLPPSLDAGNSKLTVARFHEQVIRVTAPSS